MRSRRNNVYRVEEFELSVGKDGSLKFPTGVLRRLPAGGHFVARLSAGKLNPVLRRRGITEDDIERIARAQLEPRENVVRFLLAEGAFARNPNPAGVRRRGK